MNTPFNPGLTGTRLDRADQIRIKEDRLAEVRSSLRARLLKLNDLDPEIGPDNMLVWGSMIDRPDDSHLLFLGMEGDTPYFAPLIEDAPPTGQAAYAVWRYLDIMPPEEASTYAAARSLIEWHRGHLFCSRCGSRSEVSKGGWGRTCGNCGAEHFPRVDPVVIMLATYEDKALVGRQPRFPPDRYSALAGFVEPGESLEGAVTRELFEEAGVHATSVRYLSSQPWPFPNTLMMACIAPVESDELTLDTEELEAAKWVTKQQVLDAFDGAVDAQFIAPPHFAIAHTLLRAWAEDQ